MKKYREERESKDDEPATGIALYRLVQDFDRREEEEIREIDRKERSRQDQRRCGHFTLRWHADRVEQGQRGKETADRDEERDERLQPPRMSDAPEGSGRGMHGRHCEADASGTRALVTWCGNQHARDPSERDSLRIRSSALLAVNRTRGRPAFNSCWREQSDLPGVVNGTGGSWAIASRPARSNVFVTGLLQFAQQELASLSIPISDDQPVGGLKHAFSRHRRP